MNLMCILCMPFQCLDHFKHLAKHGSVNAKPVYMFMLAMQSPSSDAFEKAIGACAEAGMIHLEAMANERYAMFLYEDKIEALANEYMTSSFWLYQDWGAQAKVIQLTQQYNFLKVCISSIMNDKLFDLDQAQHHYLLDSIV